MTQDEFYELLDRVNDQGGSHLPGKCKPTRIEYPSGKPHLTTGCMRESRLTVPFDGDQGVGIIVCAFDDMVHLWARFS